MAAPTPLVAVRSGTPDATNGIQLPVLPLASSTSLSVPSGLVVSDQIANGPSPHRAALTTTDVNKDMVGFGSSASCAEFVYNRGALTVWAEFASSCGQAVVRPIWFDGQTTPQPIGYGPRLTFTALELFTATGLSSCGDKLSQPQLVDTIGARMFKLRLETLTNSSDGVDLFAAPI